MKRPDERATIVFLTQQAPMGLDSTRFVYRLADSMSAVGYRTAVLNTGTGLPRPFWLVAPFLSLESAESVRHVLGLHSPRIDVPTTWQMAYAAADACTDGAGCVFLADDLDVPRAEDEVAARLMLRAFGLGPVLTRAPIVAEALSTIGADVRRLPIAVDAPYFEAAGEVEEHTVLIYSDPNLPKPDDIAAEALRLALTQVPGLKLRGFGYAETCKYIPREDFVALNWFDEDAPVRAAAYATSSCFLWTRPYDPVSLQVLEAMASGCPVVAVRGGGNEAFCTDGENCLLAPKDDPQALADALVRLAGDAALRERLSAAGRETAAGRTWERLLDALPDRLKSEQRVEGARGLGAVRWE